MPCMHDKRRATLPVPKLQGMLLPELAGAQRSWLLPLYQLLLRAWHHPSCSC
jgi:hypothetical protein